MFNKILLASGLLSIASVANAAYEIKLTDKDTITFGGFIKADSRTVSGDIAYRDFFIGTGTVTEDSNTQTRFLVNETRFNTKYQHGDVTGFIELDFFGGGGNQVISNSSNPRIRHAFIKYKNVLIGQTWSTFMNTSSLVESADFGGPHVAESFIRNSQIRYTNGGFEIALENPETFSNSGSEIQEDPDNDALPDLIVKYSLKGDWGNVSFTGLARQLNTTNTAGDEFDDTSLGFNIAGRIKTIGKDDFRFTVSKGELGRYVGTTAAFDIFNGEVEDITAYVVAYRHFWSDNVRSTIFYGNATTEESDADRSHYAINIFKNYTPKLSFGAELGVFDQKQDISGSAPRDADSTYFQLTAKYVL